MKGTIMNRIAELRKEKGVSLKKMAEELKNQNFFDKISDATISRYESHDPSKSREPKLETWQKLAEYFDVSVGYLQGIGAPQNEEEYFKHLINHTIHSSNDYMKNTDDEIFQGWLMFITSLYEQSKADQKLEDVDDLITGLSLISNELVLGFETSKGLSGVDEGLKILNQTIKKLKLKKHVIFKNDATEYMSDDQFDKFIKKQNKKASDDKPETN